MAKNVLMCLPGTWEAGNGPRGALRSVSDRLDPKDWDVWYPDESEYPTSFGPINPPPGQSLTTASYAKSVTQGAKAVLNHYNTLEADQLAHVIGYSQGEECGARGTSLIVQQEGMSRGKLRTYTGFGCPSRPQGHTYSQGGALDYAGIAVYRQPLTTGIVYSWFNFPTDVFGNSNPVSFNTLGYILGTNFSLSPDLFSSEITQLVQSGELQNYFLKQKAAASPPKVQDSIAAALGGDLFTADYWTTFLEHMGGSIIDGVIGATPFGPLVSALGIDPADLFYRAINTITQLAGSANGSHGWYFDPAHPIKGNQTAADHSFAYLNYVGKNGPVGG